MSNTKLSVRCISWILVGAMLIACQPPPTRPVTSVPPSASAAAEAPALIMSVNVGPDPSIKPLPTSAAMALRESGKTLHVVDVSELKYQMPEECLANGNFRSLVAPNWVFILRAPKDPTQEFSGCLRFWHSDKTYEPTERPTDSEKQNNQNATPAPQPQSGFTSSSKKTVDIDVLLKAEETHMFTVRETARTAERSYVIACNKVNLTPQSLIATDQPIEKLDFAQFESLMTSSTKIISGEDGINQPGLSPTPLASFLRDVVSLSLKAGLTETKPDIDFSDLNAGDFNNLQKSAGGLSSLIKPDWQSHPANGGKFNRVTFEDAANCLSAVQTMLVASTKAVNTKTWRNYALIPCNLIRDEGVTTPLKVNESATHRRMEFDGKSYIECLLNVKDAIKTAKEGIENKQGTDNQGNASKFSVIHPHMVYSDVAVLFTGILSTPIGTNGYESPLLYYSPITTEHNSLRSFGLFAADDSLRAVVPVTTSVLVSKTIDSRTMTSKVIGGYRNAYNELYVNDPLAETNESDNYIFIHTKKSIKHKTGPEYLPPGERLWRRNSDSAREFDPTSIYGMSNTETGHMYFYMGDVKILIGGSPLSPGKLKGSFEILIIDPGGGAKDGVG